MKYFYNPPLIIKILNKDFSLIVNLPRRIMPFTLLDRGIARHGDKVYFNEKHIGFVTSGTKDLFLNFI